VVVLVVVRHAAPLRDLAERCNQILLMLFLRGASVSDFRDPKSTASALE